MALLLQATQINITCAGHQSNKELSYISIVVLTTSSIFRNAAEVNRRKRYKQIKLSTMDITLNKRSRSVHGRFASRAPLIVLFLLMVEQSDAFHLNLMKGTPRSIWGVNTLEAAPTASVGQPSYYFSRKTDNCAATVLAMGSGSSNEESDKAALQSMLDQAVTLSSQNKSAAPAVKDELQALMNDMKAALEAPAPGTRSKAEVAKLLDEALSTYMDSMMSGSPTVDEDKAKMEALALEVGQINDDDASGATAVSASIPLASFQERLDAVMAKMSAQSVATTKKEPVDAPPAPPPAAATVPGETKQLLDAAFGRMLPKKGPPKPEKDGNTGVPSLIEKKSSKPAVENKENAELEATTNVPISKDAPAMVVKENTELEATTTVPISKDAPAMVMKEKKEKEEKSKVSISNDPPVISGKENKDLEASTVVPISNDAPAMVVEEKKKKEALPTVPISNDPPIISGKESTELEASTVVPISNDAPAMVRGNKKELESSTVVPISKESPASFSQQSEQVKKPSGDVKVALSKPQFVQESERSTKPRKESAPALEIVAEQSSSKADDRKVVEEQPTVETLPAKGKSVSEPVVAGSTGGKATDPAGSLPPIVFPPGDAPDVNDLRRLLDEATVWFVAHGNEVDPSLRKEVEEMIEEMDHILYFATCKSSGSTSTPRRAVLAPDSHNDTTETASTKKESPDSLVVSGALALEFFQERLSGLPGYERSKEEVVIKEKPKVEAVLTSEQTKELLEQEAKAKKIAAAYIPKAKAIAETYVSKPKKSSEPAKPKVVLSNPAGLGAVDAAFKTLATGTATSGEPRVMRGSSSLDSDSTYVSLN